MGRPSRHSPQNRSHLNKKFCGCTIAPRPSPAMVPLHTGSRTGAPTPESEKQETFRISRCLCQRKEREDMTESPSIHHRPTRRRLLATAGVFPDLAHHQRGSGGVLLGLAAGRHRPVDARGGRSPPSCQPHPSCAGCAWVDAGSALIPRPAHRPQPPLKRREKAPSQPPALFRQHGNQGLNQSPDSRTGRTPALDERATRPDVVTVLRSPIAQRERRKGRGKPEEGGTVSASNCMPKERRSIERPNRLLTIVLFNPTAGLCRQPEQPFC